MSDSCCSIKTPGFFSSLMLVMIMCNCQCTEYTQVHEVKMNYLDTLHKEVFLLYVLKCWDEYAAVATAATA